MCGALSVSRCWKVVFLLTVIGSLAIRPGDLSAQEGLIPPLTVGPGVVTAGGTTGSQEGSGIVPVGCASCGGGLLAPPPLMDGGCGPGGCGGCGSGCCYPGRTGCDCCCDDCAGWGKFLCGLYKCICCPDPCYEPRWVPLANAGFFVDTARPATQIGLSGNFNYDIKLPDKAEWFWAMENGRGPHASGTSGAPGVGALAGLPGVPAGAGPGIPGESKVRLDRDFMFYTEGAVDRFSLFVALDYRNVEPETYPSASGFGDMYIGTKSVLVDCELTQITFQFKTYIPTGTVVKGLGDGHVSLEPSLVAAVKLTPDLYLQAQIAYWGAIGGTNFEGDVFHYHLSLNYLLWNCGHDIQLISTLECGGYEICAGQYTDPLTGKALRAVDVGDIFEAGAGLRLSICNKIDFGVGTMFAVGQNDMNGQEQIRGEFRWRF